MVEVKGQMGEVKGKLNEQAEKLDEVNAQIKHPRDKMISMTPTTQATYIESQIVGQNRSTTFVQCAGEISVLTTQQQSTVSNFEEEKFIVAYLLPILEHFFEDTDRVVVDSQSLPWLDPGFDGALVKPDGFLCHRGMYIVRARSSEEGSGPRCGIPADKRLYDSVVPIEGKRGATIVGQLELVNYMNLMSNEILCGLLIGREEFWLIEAHNRVVIKRIKAKWVDGGSVKLIRDFFLSSPWTKALCAVSKGLNRHVLNCQEKRTAFLGAGGAGRVFHLSSENINSRIQQALKIVLPLNRGQLEQEFQQLSLISREQPTAPVVTVSNYFRCEFGAGYVLEPVGVCVEEEKEINVNEVFSVLQALHQSTFTHGDARLANLIRTNRRLLWIDFIASRRSATKREFQADCFQLAASVLNHANRTRLRPTDLELEGNAKFTPLRAGIAEYSAPSFNFKFIPEALAVLKGNPI